MRKQEFDRLIATDPRATYNPESWVGDEFDAGNLAQANGFKEGAEYGWEIAYGMDTERLLTASFAWDKTDPSKTTVERMKEVLSALGFSDGDFE